MSVRLVSGATDPKDEFGEYLKQVEDELNLCHSQDDFSNWIAKVREHSKSQLLTQAQNNQLTALRQRAYRKKRESVSLEPVKTQTNNHQSKNLEENEMSVAAKRPKIVRDSLNTTFLEGVKAALETIDGEKFTASLPKVLLSLGSTGIVLWFLWYQSTTLYRSGGFADPEIAATGALIMILGFSAYHAIHRSKLALLGCLYIGAYEMYFMASGTVNDEKSIAISTPEIARQQEWHQENIANTKVTYESAKQRFEDPLSKVHQNLWFKKKHLDPAWQKYSEAQNKATTYSEDLNQSHTLDHIAWIKLLYRIGIVVLAMLLVHQSARILIMNPRRISSHYRSMDKKF